MLGALQNNKKKKTEQNAQFLFCTSNEREICGVVRRLLLGSDEDEFDLNPQRFPIFTLVGLNMLNILIQNADKSQIHENQDQYL